MFYIFRVRSRNVARFADISRAAGAIYRDHGAAGSDVMPVTESAGKYGCMGLERVVVAEPDEKVYLGHDWFRDVDEFERVTTAVDADPRIGELYGAFQQVVDLCRVVRWEADGTG